MSNEIRTAIQKLAGTHLSDQVYLLACNVESVNIMNRTCDCVAIESVAVTDIPNVQLMADVEDGFLIVPVIGSTVIVTMSKRSAPFVSMFSAVDKVYMVANNFQFNDGSHGGLVRVIDLTTKLNNLENDINTLKQAFATWTPVPNDGGAALKAASAEWFGSDITPTERTDIENILITHGD